MVILMKVNGKLIKSMVMVLMFTKLLGSNTRGNDLQARRVVKGLNCMLLGINTLEIGKFNAFFLFDFENRMERRRDREFWSLGMGPGMREVEVLINRKALGSLFMIMRKGNLEKMKLNRLLQRSQ